MPKTGFEREIIELSRRWAEIHKPVQDLTARLAEIMKPAVEAAQMFKRQIAEATIPLQPFITALIEENKKYKRVETLGWMPHTTAPWDKVDADNISDDDLTELMIEHYRDNWSSIANQFSTAVKSYDVDDEAKDTFAEALSAHGCGFYRCSPRLLFPEIERVARAEIHGGAMDKMASQDRLRERISELSPRDMAATGLMGTRFYSKLVEHLYSNIHDADALEKITLDPVPNRHATVHGLTSYKSLQSSINSLILADFIFNAISTIKRLDLEEAELLSTS